MRPFLILSVSLALVIVLVLTEESFSSKDERYKLSETVHITSESPCVVTPVISSILACASRCLMSDCPMFATPGGDNKNNLCAVVTNTGQLPVGIWKVYKRTGSCVSQSEVDVALQKELATQSTTGGASVASRALDGNTDGILGHKSCTYTGQGKQVAWWTVPLPGLHMISEVHLYNRVDCCSERLGPVDVYVEDGCVQKLCGSYTEDTTNKVVVKITCEDGATGDRIRVVLPGNNRILTLCEVKAFGFSDTSC